MLKYRIISFPLLLALAFAAVLWQPYGSWLLALLSLSVTAAAVWECCNIAARLSLPTVRSAACLAAMLAMIKYGWGAVLTDFRAVLPGGETIMAGLLVLLMLVALLSRDREKAVKAALATPGVVLLALLPVLALARIYFEFGEMTFLALVLATKAADTGGYIVGMLSNKLMKNGNHKIVPAISPKKSWEGTIGAMVFSIVTALLLGHWECITLPCWVAVLFGFGAFLGSFAGDLTESQLKRAADIKDSGHWLPGMGGILDLIDSFIYNAPLFYLALASGVIICQ